MIGDYLDQYTYTYLLQQALARVPDTVDKREGSIIYDALAPACYELAEFYMNLKQILQQSYASLATGEYLDARVAEQGMTRITATYAVMKGVFLDSGGIGVSIPLGTRFQSISDEYEYVYAVTALLNDDVTAGEYELTCETVGSDGNVYRGNLMPVDYISGLATAQLTDVIAPARDVETDEELRERYFEAVENRPFGGNIAQYKQEIKLMEGVGGVQVYPAWDGGGTVKVSIIGTDYLALSAERLAEIQNELDPEPEGTGLGLVPIGHIVTVVSPYETPIFVNAAITATAETAGGISAAITEAIESYLLSLRQRWDEAALQNVYSMTIYWARVLSTILSVPGVINVSSLILNGMPGQYNITMTQSGLQQGVPVLGSANITVTTEEL